MCDKKDSSAMQRVDNNIRVYDQTASMHFRMADKYRTFSSIENILEILFSVILCGCTFLNINNYNSLNQWFGQIDFGLVMGISSIALFAFTLIKQALNHHQRFEQHNLAGKMYVQVKLELKLKKIEWIENETEDAIIKDYLKQRAISLNDLPQIPENKFVKYKHWHVRKVEWSQFVDTHRAAPWYWLKLLFFLKGIGIYDNPKKKKNSNEEKKDHPENDDLKHSPQL